MKRWEAKRHKTRERMERRLVIPPLLDGYMEAVQNRLHEPALEPDELRQLYDSTSQGFARARRILEREYLRGEGERMPLNRVHRACRDMGLMHCQVHVEPPAYIDSWAWKREPTYRMDRYGRILFMTKGVKEAKRVRADEFAPMPVFEQIYPMHPDPEHATQEEKDQRMSAFLNAYSASGVPTASAAAVGVGYHWLLLWLNESELWQSRFALAQDGAKRLLEDIGRVRAIRGDSALLTFFIKHDNPERYGAGAKKDKSTLPEGVTQESVADALRVIGAAKGGALEAMRKALPEAGSGEGVPALVDQTDDLSGYEMPVDDDEDMAPVQASPSPSPRDKTVKTIDMQAGNGGD